MSNKQVAAFNAAIDFALEEPMGLAFLSLWREGDWDAIALEWPDFDLDTVLSLQEEIGDE